MRDHVEYETGDMHELAIRLPANVAIWNRLRLVSDSRGLAGPLLFIIPFLFWRASLERFQPGKLDTLIILQESFRAGAPFGDSRACNEAVTFDNAKSRLLSAPGKLDPPK